MDPREGAHRRGQSRAAVVGERRSGCRGCPICPGTAAAASFTSHRNGKPVGRPGEVLSPGSPSNLPYAVGDLLLRAFLKCPQCFVTGYQTKRIGAAYGAP